MDVPPETMLEGTYIEAANRARRHVASRYPLEDCPPDSDDYPPERHVWREVWSVVVPELSGRDRLLIAVPRTFPDILPLSYLTKSAALSIGWIPHLDDKRLLCGFDESSVRLDAERPEEIALSIVERARKNLSDGVSGRNVVDFSDELGAYWAMGNALRAFSLVIPDERHRRAVAIRVLSSWKGCSYLFAETELQGRQWLTSAGYDGKVETNSVLYLPLHSLGMPPLPLTNGEIFNCLKRHDEAALIVLLDYLRTSPRPAGILSSVPAGDGGRMLIAWWHPSFAYETYGGREVGRRISGVVKGFRKGKHPVNVELSQNYSREKLTRAVVTRVDRDRLFQRTTGAPPVVFAGTVNIIGCGSVGSRIAAGLAQTGSVEMMRLVDPQELDVENVPRHYCGMSEVGQYKTKATATKITQHFPHLQFETIEKDILSLLLDAPDSLSGAELYIIAIGDFAVERRLSWLAGNGAFLKSPVCFVWVEPHLYAGHALYTNPGRPGCFECLLDDQLLFTNRIIRDAKNFPRREAGCQTTFVPYSGLDTDQFVGAFIRFLLTDVGSNNNRVLSWVGDLDKARRERIEIGDEWQTASSYSSRTTILAPNECCLVCGRRANIRWAAM